MLKSILLLTPVYVALFWTIVLHIGSNKKNPPRNFLGKFMIVAFVVYGSLYVYFSLLKDFYYYIDPFYWLATLAIYPMCHIYFRLLIVDSKFNLKDHFKYLILPLILFVMYYVGVILSSKNDLINWLFEGTVNKSSPSIIYLVYLKYVIKVSYAIMVILIIIANFRLVNKYKEKAKNYYSNYHDTTSIKIHLINIIMIITGISSMVLIILGRVYLHHKIHGLGIASAIFSSMLFLIGWLGERQKVLNPFFESLGKKSSDEPEVQANESLIDKVLVLFDKEKVYLDTNINIIDVATSVGTNRSYISSIINQKFNQNFCSFVNEYRFKELQNKVLSDGKQLPLSDLAESCGFGSVISMKRAVQNKTGKSFSLWRTELQEEQTRL